MTDTHTPVTAADYAEALQAVDHAEAMFTDLLDAECEKQNPDEGTVDELTQLIYVCRTTRTKLRRARIGSVRQAGQPCWECMTVSKCEHSPRTRCADHPAYEADYCPLCGTAQQIGGTR